MSLIDRRDLPRALVVSPHTFEQYSGPGISNVNLFGGWPRERLVSVYSDDLSPEEARCAAFYKLTPADMDYPAPLAFLRDTARKIVGARTVPEAAASAAVGPLHGAAPRGLVRSLRPKLTRQARKLAARTGVFELTNVVTIRPPLGELLDRFQPQIIYTMLGSLGYVRLVRAIADRYRIPFVVHIADDWPDSQLRAPLSRPLRATLAAELVELLGGAARRYAICHEMCEAYRERYGLAFQPLISPIDTERWLPHAKQDWSVAGTFRVVYLGTVQQGGRSGSIEEVARAVSELKGEGHDIAFEIYTVPDHIAPLRARIGALPGIALYPSPKSADAPPLLGAADMLVITSDFDPGAVRWLKYSLPAKCFAYMISSSPILVYGPKGMPPIEYARSHGWGEVVDERGVPALKRGLARLLKARELRERYGLRARDVAIANHDSARVRSRFQTELSEAADRAGSSSRAEVSAQVD